MTKGQAYRFGTGLIRVGMLSLLLACAMSLAGSAFDHPVNDALAAGMTAPECAKVRLMQAGSLFSPRPCRKHPLPDTFLYRAAFSDAPAHMQSYTALVARSRVEEFHQLVGYAWMLWLVIVIGSIALVDVVRRLISVFRCPVRPQDVSIRPRMCGSAGQTSSDVVAAIWLDRPPQY